MVTLKKLEARLREDMKALLAKARATDREERPDGLDLPAELAHREERLKRLAAAKAELEARANDDSPGESRQMAPADPGCRASARPGATPPPDEPCELWTCIPRQVNQKNCAGWDRVADSRIAAC
jgi:hypothetical protein